MNQRTITVKGTGKASLPPDYIEIPLYLESRDERYEQAIELASQKLEELQQCLEGIGFKKEDLKTSSFTVDTDYEQVKDEEGNYVRVFRGYIVRHHLSIGFDFNTEKLGEVIQTISDCPAHPEFSIQYQLKNETALTSLILEDAVKQATRQANVLAQAAGVTLGPIQAIEYDWSTISYQPRELLLNESANHSMTMMDLQPQDISATDYVTIVWELI